MKLAVLALVMLVMSAATAGTPDDRALKPYAGKIVISPDAPPGDLAGLPAYLKANATSDGRYEPLHWDVFFAAVVAKPVTKVTLVVADPADKKSPPLMSFELAAQRLVVLGHFTPTTTAGFEAGKTYAVTLIANKAIVAKAQLALRPE